MFLGFSAMIVYQQLMHHQRCESELLVREQTLSGQISEEEGAGNRINLNLFRSLLGVPGVWPGFIPRDAANVSRACQHLLIYRFFDIGNRICNFEGDVALHSRQPFIIQKSFVSILLYRVRNSLLTQPLTVSAYEQLGRCCDKCPAGL
jgi:hypothetical protein